MLCKTGPANSLAAAVIERRCSQLLYRSSLIPRISIHGDRLCPQCREVGAAVETFRNKEKYEKWMPRLTDDQKGHRVAMSVE